jgi:diacylglycerol kinase family enzyme
MDVVLVRPVPRWQLLFRLGTIYRGTHLEADFVSWKRARQLELEPRAPLPPFDLDGEVFASAPSTIRLREKALRILA